MNDAQAATQMLEEYLARVRVGLRGLPAEEITEIVQELRSHVLDRTAADGPLSTEAVRAAVLSLGGAEHLARQYQTEKLFARTHATRSPSLLLQSLFRWATLSVWGFFVCLGSFAAYFLAGSLLLATVMKFLRPHRVGLWLLPGEPGQLSLRMGFGSLPASGQEVLGWWLVPVGLLVAAGLVLVTFHIDLWTLQMFRQLHRLPTAVSGPWRNLE